MTDTIDVRRWIGDNFPTICTFQSEEAAWIEEAAWVEQAAQIEEAEQIDEAVQIEGRGRSVAKSWDKGAKEASDASRQKG
jgi:hypothetical protein